MYKNKHIFFFIYVLSLSGDYFVSTVYHIIARNAIKLDYVPSNMITIQNKIH